MGRNAEMRFRHTQSVQDHPDLVQALEAARKNGDEEAIWDVLSEGEQRLVGAWPDLKHIYQRVEGPEPSEVREAILDEAERRRSVMKDLRRRMEALHALGSDQ